MYLPIGVKRAALPLKYEIIDGIREYYDTYDDSKGVGFLDYISYARLHKEEAKYRNHRTRGAISRSPQNSSPFTLHVWPCGCGARLHKKSRRVFMLISKLCLGKPHVLPWNNVTLE